MKRRSTDDDIHAFMAAVYPLGPALATAVFDEATVLREATRQITVMREALREILETLDNVRIPLAALETIPEVTRARLDLARAHGKKALR